MMSKIRENWNSLKKDKASPVLVLLMIVNTVVLLIANIIAAKTFTLFSINGLAVVLPCAVVVYPIIYIISDILSEVYGYKWSRRAAWVSFAMNFLMVAIFELAILMPGETDLGVLKSTWFLLVASALSYIIGGLANDLVFRGMKKKALKLSVAPNNEVIDSNSSGIVFRAIWSSIVGQFCDSLIYIPLGMNIFPKLFFGFEFMSWPQVAVCVLLQPTIKVIYEIIISPLTVKSCKLLRKYETEVGNVYGL